VRVSWKYTTWISSRGASAFADDLSVKSARNRRIIPVEVTARVSNRAIPWSQRWASAVKIFLDEVGRTVARVSAEEHMASYRASEGAYGKGRNAGEGAAFLTTTPPLRLAEQGPVKTVWWLAFSSGQSRRAEKD
jgi:hypothetical protein